ncbi:MAG: hypothetical protein V2A77_07615 [Pseudomonadota bacterium]
MAAAFSLELRPLLRLAEGLSRLHSPRGTRLWQGTLGSCPLLLLKMGMGAEAARRSLSMLDGRPLAAVISIGTCAGLIEDLRRGDLVAARMVADQAGRAYLCYRGLADMAMAAAGRLPHQTAHLARRLECVASVVSDPAERRRLALRFGAAAADMESSEVAGYAAQRGVPFLALKVVSDCADSWMLPLDPRGWLAHPLHRALRLPLYLAGLARTAVEFGKIKRGLASCADVVGAIAAASVG